MPMRTSMCESTTPPWPPPVIATWPRVITVAGQWENCLLHGCHVGHQGVHARLRWAMARAILPTRMNRASRLCPLYRRAVSADIQSGTVTDQGGPGSAAHHFACAALRPGHTG